jgi:hypothetical protein
MKECDNKSACHSLAILSDSDLLRVICTQCKHQYFIRKVPGKNVPLNRQYQKIFKKDTLQGNDNLFYKYNPQFISK